MNDSADVNLISVIQCTAQQERPSAVQSLNTLFSLKLFCFLEKLEGFKIDFMAYIFPPFMFLSTSYSQIELALF